jgi:hypothetical protein
LLTQFWWLNRKYCTKVVFFNTKVVISLRWRLALVWWHSMRLRVTAVLFGTLVLGVMPLSRGVPAAASARADVWVEAREDYDPGRYQGPLQPSPPHADGNPRRAVIVGWRAHSTRLVFSHEASYCPFLELPSGAAMSNQFFEGNLGEAELMNEFGRRERNSTVTLVEARPDRVWVRWTYQAVNMKSDAQPRLRGTEDYRALANGLTLRTASYQSLLPHEVIAYSTQPVELFGIIPLGKSMAELMPRDPETRKTEVLRVAALDWEKEYAVFWGESGTVHRSGDDTVLREIARSPGYALILPFREGLLFAVLGPASGFPSANVQLIDHSTPGAEGGAGWGQGRWDHWPVGWLNSQASDWKPGSRYPYSFGSIGLFLVPDGKRIQSFWADYSALCRDMDFNRWTEARRYHVLLGTARTMDEVRNLGRAWLDLGPLRCGDSDAVAALRLP